MNRNITITKTTDAEGVTRINMTKMTADYHYMGLRNPVAEPGDKTTWMDDMILLILLASIVGGCVMAYKYFTWIAGWVATL